MCILLDTNYFEVRTTLCAASQLPGEEPTDVEYAPAPAC